MKIIPRHINLIKSKILKEDDHYLLSCETEELVDFYLQNAELLEPVEINFEQMTFSTRREVVVLRSHERSFPYNSQGDLEMEKEYVDVCIPVTDDKNIYLINNLRTRIIVSGGSPDFKVEGKEIVVTIETRGYQVKLNGVQIKREVEEHTERIRSWFDFKNSEINRNNSEALKLVRDFIEDRKKKLVDDNSKINELSKILAIPLKKNQELNSTKVRLQRKRIVERIKPSGNEKSEQYVLDRNRVLDLITIIDNQGHQFERIPNTCLKLQEEDLRDLILVGLNAIFEGSATGRLLVKMEKQTFSLE